MVVGCGGGLLMLAFSGQGVGAMLSEFFVAINRRWKVFAMAIKVPQAIKMPASVNRWLPTQISILSITTLLI